MQTLFVRPDPVGGYTELRSRKPLLDLMLIPTLLRACGLAYRNT